jgi:MFS family permease
VSVVTGAGTLIGGMMFGISSFVPLYIQGVHGGSPIQAGLTIAPFSIGWSIASVASGQIIIRAGYRLSAVAGVIASVIGCVALLRLSPDSGWLPAALGSGFVGIGMGLTSTAMLISVQNSVGWGQRGVATSLVQFSRTIGGSIGVAALGTLLTVQMQSRLVGVDTDVSSANDVLDSSVRNSLTPAALQQLTDALAGALHDVYFGMFIVSLLAAAVVVVLFPRGSVEDLQGNDDEVESRIEDETRDNVGAPRSPVVADGGE